MIVLETTKVPKDLIDFCFFFHQEISQKRTGIYCFVPIHPLISIL